MQWKTWRGGAASIRLPTRKLRKGDGGGETTWRLK
jgi:hypothetical protein